MRFWDFTKKNDDWKKIIWSNFQKIWKSRIFGFSKNQNFWIFLRFSKNPKILIFLRKSKILRFSDFSKIRDFFDFSKIRDFSDFSKIQSAEEKKSDHQKIFFSKISKLHRKTFQEHPATPPNSSWARRTSYLDLELQVVIAALSHFATKEILK